MEPGASTDIGTEERRNKSISHVHALPHKDGSETEVDEAQVGKKDEWRISRHELYIILSLTVINMVVALDASVIVTALNVSCLYGF